MTIYRDDDIIIDSKNNFFIDENIITSILIAFVL